MALADNYDALSTALAYKKAWTLEDRAAEIHKLSSNKFDPALVTAFDFQESQFQAIAIRFQNVPVDAQA